MRVCVCTRLLFTANHTDAKPHLFQGFTFLRLIHLNKDSLALCCREEVNEEDRVYLLPLSLSLFGNRVYSHLSYISAIQLHQVNILAIFVSIIYCRCCISHLYACVLIHQAF